MKRENFEIIKYGVYLETKHAWNSSIRAIEADVNKVARKENTVYHLTDSGWILISHSNPASGHRTWKSKHGSVLLYEINKV